MEWEQLNLDEFDQKLRPFLTEVSSSSLGGQVIGCSDDFFASRHNLIKPTPSVSMKGQFGPTGALYDAWESRRHNPAFDWVIILLATPLTHLSHVDIDTSHFSGNECPESQIFALQLDQTPAANGLVDGKSTKKAGPLKLSPNDPRWQEILPVVALGPNSRHIFKLGQKANTGTWSAVMVRMIPDGGMARFRAYGQPVAPAPLASLPDPSTPPINLLSPLLSARIVACSDANFSPPGNLLLPGRGHDMSDGWETRRSQVGKGKYAKGQPLEGKERCEWVVARLAGTGAIRWVEVDTAFHPGNYPVACKVEAILSEDDLPSDSAGWTTIVEKKPLGSHRQHWFDLERLVSPGQVFSHVKLTTVPDGGLKRLRVWGHPLAPSPSAPLSSELIIPTLPLTPETFKAFGEVVQGFSFGSSAPKGIHVTVANQGTAAKFHRMVNVKNSYQSGALTRGGTYVAVTTAKSRMDIRAGLKLPVQTLERHRHTSQTFIPMGSDKAAKGAHIVVAALNGKDDRPDMSTARAFIATSAQGVSYNEGIWHHSLITVNEPIQYALIETQIGDGSVLDCEKYTPPSPYAYLQIPPFDTLAATSPATRHVNGISTLDKLTDLLPSLPNGLGSSTLTPTLITPSSFEAFGKMLKPYPENLGRSDVDIQVAPDGMATKYARLADVVSTYPESANAVTAISVFRATPKVGLERGKAFDIRFMERHPYTSQAFIPMGKAEWSEKGEEALPEGGQMLVIVAQNGPDDRPVASTLKAFIVPCDVGISYNPGVWHHPTLVLDQTVDLACVETQVSTGIPEADERDCELLEWEEEALGSVQVPLL